MNIGYWLITFELEQMSRYLNLVQNSLDQHFAKLEASYHEEVILEMTADEAALMEDQYLDAYIERGRDFPRLLLLSFIITWYSFVEQQLIELCAALKLSIPVGPKDGENLGKGIRRARRFLLKAKGYEIDSNAWQELVRIGNLRNIIVHEGKSISGSYMKPESNCASLTDESGLVIYLPIEENLFIYLQKHNLVEFSPPVFIDVVPTFDYCNYLVEFGKTLFKDLYSDLMPKK